MRSLNRVILIGITVFIMVVFQSCKKKTSIPMLTTNTVTGITQTSAVSGGSITDDGNDDITVKGVCWGSTQNPTAGSNSTDDGTGMSAFTSIINGLTANNTYYVRAYATNSQGTGYGNEVSFSTSPLALASLMTYEVTSITSSSGRTGWKILDDGGGINKVGVCWSISPNPTVTDSHNETDAYDNRVYDYNHLPISCLDPKMTYYIKAYAINSAGISYGNQVSFTTSDDRIIFNTDLTYGSVTDIDGNAYKTIKIGTQTWMAENLKAEHFNDGSQIPNITAEAQWEFLTTEAYCDFNNKTSFSTIHGKLYNWYAVNNGKLCPAGWHIPSGVEWTTLIDFLGGQNTAGGKLKETGTTHWESPNEGATNQSGFTGIPGGWRSPEGFFNSFMNDGGLWWTSTEDSSDYLNAFDFYLYNVDTYILNASATKTCGFSVRCIMN